MQFFDGSFLIYDSQTKFRASVLTPESLESVGGTDVVALRYHEATDLILPFVLNKPLQSSGMFSMNNWFRDMIQNSDKIDMAKQGITGLLKQHNVPFTEEDVNAIVNIPLEAKANRESPIAQSILSYSSGDFRATSQLRRRVLVDDVTYPHPNEKYNQLEPTDQLGIHLASSEVILTHVLGDEYNETAFSTTYAPYPNRLYRFKNIVSILSTRTAKERAQQISDAIAMLVNGYGVKVEEQERRKLETKFEIIPKEHVLGNVDNDTLPVQENEEQFYNNLKAFIKYHIFKFNEEIMVNSSKEELDAKTQKDYETGNLPLRLVEYLERLLQDALEKNFYHTGNFNFKLGDFDGDGDDDSNSVDSANDGETDDAGLLVTKSDAKKSDLHYVASSYLSGSSKRFSADVWAEGIIKCMRWGDRKIKNLNVGINNTQYLDLQSMNLVTQQIADLSQFKVQSENGRTLEILMQAHVDFKPQGSKRVSSYPFILLGQEYGSIPGLDEEIAVTYILNLFDVVRSYELGQGQIFDLELVDGKFVSSYKREPLDVSDLEQIKLGNRKIKMLDELLDYGLDNAVSQMNGSSLSIIRSADFEDTKSTEPIMDELLNTPKTLRSPLVQSRFYGIFNEGAMDYDSTDLDELLNWYYQNVYPTHKELYYKVFGLGKAEESSGLNARNIPAANFFGQGGEVSVQESTEVLEEEKPFMYRVYEGTKEEIAQLKFSKITMKANGEGNVLGGCVKLESGGMLFASPEEITQYAINDKPFGLSNTVVKLLEILLDADPNHSDFNAAHCVVSEDTVINIYKGLFKK